MQVINTQEAANLINSTKGKLFSVTFVKRSDRKKMGNTPYGSLPRRKMVARKGVSKGVTGAGSKYNPADHGLITVNEFVTQPHTTRGEKGRFAGGGNMATHFRHIPIEGIELLKVGGKTYKVQPA